MFDFVGMMGIPLVPCHEFPEDAEAAFFSVHALKDSKLQDKLQELIGRGIPVLITDGLATMLDGSVPLDVPNVRILPIDNDPKVSLGAFRGRAECHPAAAFEAF